MYKWKIILILLILLLFVINYSFLDKLLINSLGDSIKNGGNSFFTGEKFVNVDRVIDGDTIVVGNDSIRLLGINSPEQGEIYYEEAREFLEGLVLDKKIGLKYGKPKYDVYNRILAFVFISHTNINVELVRWGLANIYILEDRGYEKELRDAWNECIEKNINLCEKSNDECAECIQVKKFEGQIIVFENICEFDCSLTGWKIKDEGRKKFIFGDFILDKYAEVKVIAGEGEDSKENLFWDEDYVWTATGDTLFLRDSEGKLVLWEDY